MIQLNTEENLDTHLWKNAKLSTDYQLFDKKKVMMKANIWSNTAIIIRYHVNDIIIENVNNCIRMKLLASKKVNKGSIPLF